MNTTPSATLQKKPQTIKVLFVCLGNICRSPSAEAVFRQIVALAGKQDFIEVDSCGTAAYHIGEAPDPRSIQAAQKRGYQMSQLRGRQLCANDFQIFHYILAMDPDNLSIIHEKQKQCKEYQTISQPIVGLFLDFISDNADKTLAVPDPYYGGEDGFEKVLDLVEDASHALLDDIIHTNNRDFFKL